MATGIETMAVAVANTFLVLAQREDISISNMKLQKLVYFAYRSYLHDTDKTMFNEKFEKWTFGPVLPSLYSKLKGNRDKSIIGFIKTDDEQYNMINLEQNSDVAFAIVNVWEKYKCYSANDLSEITHQPGSAWSKAPNRGYLDLSDIKSEVDYA
jgi:uncharacterized phage-associated protein